MGEIVSIHPQNPQQRLLQPVVDVIHRGGVVAYPTDSIYALGCHIGDKQAMDRIRTIRCLDKHHNFTLICRDLSELATYARVDNVAFRALKASTPGPFTFVLKASSEVPRRLMHPKRKTIGIRVPDNPIVKAMLDSLQEPMMSVTLMMPEDEYPMTDAYEINQHLGSRVDVVIDGGFCGMEPTTVVDMTADTPTILRQGAGDFLAI
ncbi:MAG: L-threonylcarbamoyladenylate synthase [Porticoccaceae bacterium]|jgi:tRNA threonylcarbamoyl adenosine modification protein (Sua5/YciO/YrdC/YwlC family)